MIKQLFFNKTVFSIALITVSSLNLFAGNKDRTGQAGAYELTINPWARSSGFQSLNSASVRGIESSNLNIAGLAFTKKTELVFSNTNWLKGSDIHLNAFGISQKVGQNGALGLSIVSMGFGEIDITTTSVPDGGIGTFSPQFFNLGLSYARVFSNSIYGGLTVRAISEAIADVKAQGMSIDAGIQYVTGPKDNIKFGIALRNIGTPLKFGGDGLTYRAVPPESSYQFSIEERSQRFELPSLLNIGGAYDFKLKEMHRISIVANYTSNSFFADQIGAGVEYAFREYFMLRAGYRHQKQDTDRKNAIKGFAAGFTLELPLKKDGPTVGLDYSYRATDPFKGIHSIGGRVNL